MKFLFIRNFYPERFFGRPKSLLLLILFIRNIYLSGFKLRRNYLSGKVFPDENSCDLICSKPRVHCLMGFCRVLVLSLHQTRSNHKYETWSYIVWKRPFELQFAICSGIYNLSGFSMQKTKCIFRKAPHPFACLRCILGSKSLRNPRKNGPQKFVKNTFIRNLDPNLYYYY